jgi:hypothetical protein
MKASTMSSMAMTYLVRLNPDVASTARLPSRCIVMVVHNQEWILRRTEKLLSASTLPIGRHARMTKSSRTFGKHFV